MRILLLGDYSNVHSTLAEGLRALGHEVTVASDGDGWKNYPRDIDWQRTSLPSTLWRIGRSFLSFRGYDIVQLINPVFLPLKAERHWAFYRYLRRFNKKVFLGAFGMDHYWVKAGTDCTTFRYSDFNLGSRRRESDENDVFIRDWLHGEKGRLNRYVANDCDGIIAGLYEYYASYHTEYADKLTYIPFPIRTDLANAGGAGRQFVPSVKKVRLFIGIQRSRHAYKGTDLLLQAAEKVVERYPEASELVRVENVPFATYRELLLSSHVLLDQIYSYTPAMNALEAMARGLIVVSGAEPEYYALQGEKELRPIINVLPTVDSIYEQLCHLVEQRAFLPQLSADSRTFIARHHDYLHIARAYVRYWESMPAVQPRLSSPL